MAEFLQTLEKLYEVGYLVGPLDVQSFESLERTGKRLAKRFDIENIKFVIDAKDKPEYRHSLSNSEPHMPTPLSRDTWKVLLNGLDIWEEVPDVYLIDGDQFTASI